MLLYPLDNDDADLLMRIIGSCLLEGNHAERFAILEGEPQSSKTTIVNIVEGIIGRQNAGELRTHLLEERFEIGRLVGKTLLTARDVAGNFMQHRSSYVLKRLVGHDHVEGEIKGSMQSFKITGDYAVLITSNETLLVWLRGKTDMKACGDE
jgi:phage/plasmid-associated DNA primase